jgi:hypothetical protein
VWESKEKAHSPPSHQNQSQTGSVSTKSAIFASGRPKKRCGGKTRDEEGSNDFQVSQKATFCEWETKKNHLCRWAETMGEVGKGMKADKVSVAHWKGEGRDAKLINSQRF